MDSPPAPAPGKRRYDIARRSLDGRWNVWKRICPPKHVSTEWSVVHVAGTRKDAFEWMRAVLKLQHKDSHHV